MLEKIFKIICQECGTTPYYALQKSRKENLRIARQLFMYITQEHLNVKQKNVKIFLNQDHTTVVSGVKRMRDMIESDRPDKDIKTLFDNIMERLNNVDNNCKTISSLDELDEELNNYLNLVI